MSSEDNEHVKETVRRRRAAGLHVNTGRWSAEMRTRARKIRQEKETWEEWRELLRRAWR